MGTPPKCLPHGFLGNVAKHYGIWVPLPPVDRQKDRHVSKHYLPVVLRTRAVIKQAKKQLSNQGSGIPVKVCSL